MDFKRVCLGISACTCRNSGFGNKCKYSSTKWCPRLLPDCTLLGTRYLHLNKRKDEFWTKYYLSNRTLWGWVVTVFIARWRYSKVSTNQISSSSIYIKISSLFCENVYAVHFKRRIHTVGTKHWKKLLKNTHSPIIDGRLSDRPDRRHDNPLKPDRTRDDVGKTLGQIDRRGIYIREYTPSLGDDFLRFLGFLDFESEDRASR